MHGDLFVADGIYRVCQSAIVLSTINMPINSYLTSISKQEQGKFALGEIALTLDAQAEISLNEIKSSLFRHHFGDWGEVEEDERLKNERSLLLDQELISAYHSSDGIRFWIITEHDRSLTSVLLRK